VKSGTLTGFEVAGADGKFVPATATIDGNTVVAASPAVADPVFVRYGWANSPECNLFNGVGLPASPFTSVP
jgi:sialate O-acetylesterase